MKRLIFLPLMTVLVLAFAAAACGAGGEDSGAPGLPGRPGVPGPPGAPGAPGNPGPASFETSNDRIVREKQVSGSSGQTDADAIERKIVTDVDMNVRVDDVNGAMELVTDLVDTSGGFVVSVSRTEDEFESFAFMSFRVPSNHPRIHAFTGARYIRARRT